jgi:hypothetical protein
MPGDEEKIDLNRATREELIGLTGIGGALADRILAHRTRIGGFESVEAIEHVTGVSERLATQLRSSLSVGSVNARPAASSLTVELKAAPKADFTGHKITIDGQRRGDDGDSLLPFAASAPSSAPGGATLTVPDRSRIVGEVRVRVVGPDGTQLASKSLDGPKLPLTVTIDAEPQVFAATQPNADPSAGRPTRIRGRVIDEGGKRVPTGIQVVLWGATVPNPHDSDYRALVVAETDALGHFSGPYPLGDFSAAHATVAVDDPPPSVIVHLDAPASPAGAPATLFPESVILVVDLPDADHDHDDEGGCSCGTTDVVPRAPDHVELGRADGTFSSDPGAGRCVDFTKPDRTLEEFTYTYAVRTTEPEIRGLTLDEPAKIRLSSVTKYLDAFTAAEVTSAPRIRGIEDGDSTRSAVSAMTARTFTAGEQDVSIDAKVLKTLSRDPDGFSLATLAGAAKLTAHADLLRAVGAAVAPAPRRARLNCSNAVDWDDDPTIYQACTIAHGHILRFKQEWVADGYSMGNLLYSLPLAPGQKKQIAVVDWERRESGARTEALDASESLSALVDRDRDINEIVSGALNESVRGGSSASSSSFAGGFGIGAILGPVGALLGVGGGTSSANGSAWQNSSRNTSASALNQLRDRTIQSASSVRSQRSSVIQTVRQGERVTATTESVANYNHCHAITIQYFEVLRHLLVRQRLVDVQECLFVPLLMSWFSRAKARRWRHTLYTAVPPRLRAGFDALDRIANNYDGSDFPNGRYADENLVTVDGDLNLRFQLTRPRDNDDDTFNPNNWNPLLKLFGFDPADFYKQFLKDQAFKDRVFLEQLGPRIATSLISLLRIHALKTDGTPVDLKIDPTLITRFVNDTSLYVTLRMSSDLPAVDRASIKAIVISGRLELPGFPFTVDVLPAGSRVVVDSMTMRYRTAHHSDFLVNDSRVRNDLTGTDDVRIETPLNRQELRNPREEDKERVRNLLDHLNENIESYHHVLWARMSPDRRYMLLDGFEAPNSGGRSVASVVNNELIGIVGNCLVMPVSPGVHLDPTYNQDVKDPIDLLEHYEPNTPIDPSRIAIPTRGVYAEAVMGACNSCEAKEEERFWRWEESPIPDSPPSILPVSTDSRRSDPPDLHAQPFPTPLVALQNIPSAPDPTGLGAALSLLGQSGVFKDITGLEGTQRNAAAALEGAFNTATAFGTKAADLALQGKMSKDIDKAMKTIQSAKTQGLIDDAQAQKLTETAIRGMVGAGTATPASTTDPADVKAITETAGQNAASVKVTRPTGEQVEVDARPSGKQDGTNPIIILATASTSPANRAFNPNGSGGDKTGVITMEASFRDAPAGSQLRWSSPEAGALTIDSPNADRTRVRGLRPGRRELDVELLDAGGSRIASQKVRLSVPQYVKVVEDAAFDTALANLHLAALKNDIVANAKATVEQVLRRSNARVYWNVGGLSEAVPAHVPAANVMTVTLRDTDPASSTLFGQTKAPGGLDVFNETIDVFVGAFDNPTVSTDFDTETQALVIQLDATLTAGGVDAALNAVAAKVYGRLIGETMSHEITHGMLWDQINPPTDHNAPPIAGDLMNAGNARMFRQRTGMENTAQVSPVKASHFVDHGLGSIGVLAATNQALMDANFPTTP